MTSSVAGDNNRHPKSAERKRGFTLIELAIVLVIIGLIIGGVLTGKDLIRSAEIRAEISQMEKFRAGANTFRLKYNAFAGDMANATLMIPGVTHDGDGNGQIAPRVPALPGWNDDNQEYYSIWEHVSQAGLIPGNYNGNYAGLPPACASNGCPVSKIRPDSAFLAGDLCTVYFNTPVYNTCSHYNWFMFFNKNEIGGSGNYLMEDARDLDLKLDDGKADTGIVLTINGDYGATGCVSGDMTTTDGSANYSTAGRECILFVRF